MNLSTDSLAIYRKFALERGHFPQHRPMTLISKHGAGGELEAEGNCLRSYFGLQINSARNSKWTTL